MNNGKYLIDSGLAPCSTVNIYPSADGDGGAKK
jgi:hypothetical protein